MFEPKTHSPDGREYPKFPKPDGHPEWEHLDMLRTLYRYDPETGRVWHIARPHKDFAHDAYGYIQVSVGLDLPDGKRLAMKGHQIAFLLQHGWKPTTIDHINTTRDDNRIWNLRPATRVEQARNRTTKRGVELRKDTGLWRASIKDNRGRTHRREFRTEEQALEWRKSMEERAGWNEGLTNAGS